jgi:hypothetical protein
MYKELELTGKWTAHEVEEGTCIWNYQVDLSSNSWVHLQALHFVGNEGRMSRENAVMLSHHISSHPALALHPQPPGKDSKII